MAAAYLNTLRSKNMTMNEQDQKQLKMIARDISLQCRQAICFEAEQAKIPSIKYKVQSLLETVIADLKTFV
jgi:hypothetical protein